jgi:hypothetical protein
MPLLDRLESRFGRFAIPGLVQIIAGLKLLTFTIFVMQSAEARDRYLDFLALDGPRILTGQVWRLVTYLFIPTTLNVLFAVLSAMMLMWLGRGLEQAWGAFRMNLYFIGGMISITVCSLIFGLDESGIWLFQSLLLAFAVTYPNEEIRLYFFLPVKMKWIAWAAAALTLLTIMKAPQMAIPILFGHLNFLIVFGPEFVRDRLHMAKVLKKRTQFREASPTSAPFFHQCTICQKTEVDDPALYFRINDAGDEICSSCRKSA